MDGSQRVTWAYFRVPTRSQNRRYENLKEKTGQAEGGGQRDRVRRPAGLNSRLPGKQRAAFPPRTHRGARKNSPPPDLAVPALEPPYAQPHGEGKTGAGPSRSLFRAIAPRKNSAPGSWFRGGTRYRTALKPPGDQLPIRPAFPAPRPAPLRRTLRVSTLLIGHLPCQSDRCQRITL